MRKIEIPIKREQDTIIQGSAEWLEDQIQGSTMVLGTEKDSIGLPAVFLEDRQGNKHLLCFLVSNEQQERLFYDLEERSGVLIGKVLPEFDREQPDKSCFTKWLSGDAYREVNRIIEQAVEVLEGYCVASEEGFEVTFDDQINKEEK